MAEFTNMIRTPFGERAMMNHHGMKECQIPDALATVLHFSDEVDKSSPKFSMGAVKFVYLQVLLLCRMSVVLFN